MLVVMTMPGDIGMLMAGTFKLARLSAASAVCLSPALLFLQLVPWMLCEIILLISMCSLFF
jgi:hypothetical protein